MKNKKIKKYILIIVLLFILIFWFFPTIFLNLKIQKKENVRRVYSLVDAIAEVTSKNVDSMYNISFECQNNIVYTNELKINYDFPDSELKITINDKEYNVRGSGEINYQQLQEGKNTLVMKVYEQNEKVKEILQDIYCILPYVNQFNDESGKNGVTVHYRDSNPNYEDVDQSINQLDSLGIQYIRTDFLQSSIVDRLNDVYNFEKYDNWIKKIINRKSNIRIIAIMDGIFKHGGNRIIDSDSEIDEYIDYIEKVQDKYSQIEYFQVLNEPNSYATWKINYNNVEDIKWYSKIY